MITYFRVSYTHHPSNAHDYSSRGTSETPSEASVPATTAHSSHKLNTSFQGLGIREGTRQAGIPMGAVQQHAMRSAEPPVVVEHGKQDKTKPVRRPVCALKSDEEWLRYTEPVDEVKPERFRGLRCTWLVPDDNTGEMQACGYVQKRHLVKRHICSKHLGIRSVLEFESPPYRDAETNLFHRPWQCRVCGKTFAQLSNLETHENTQ